MGRVAGAIIAVWLAGIGVCLAAAPVQIARVERVSAVHAAAPVQLPSAAPAAQTSRFTIVPHDDDWGWRITPAANAGAGERLFLVYNPYSAAVTVLLPPDYRPQRRTLFDPDLDPRFSRHALVFPLPAGAAPFYLQVDTRSGYPLQIDIVDADAYKQADLRHLRIITAVQATLAAIAVVLLLFWLMLRERVYLLYAAYVGSSHLYLMCISGEAYVMPGYHWLTPFGSAVVWFIGMVNAALALFFLREFALLSRYAPRLSRVLLILAWVLVGLIVLLTLPGSGSWFVTAANTAMLAGELLAIAALVLAWKRGSRNAAYVLVAWLPVSALGIARGLQMIRNGDLADWVELAIPLSMAFCAVVLALGLADRMRTFRRERDVARVHAERDPLTGVLNRNGLRHRLDYLLALTDETFESLGVLYLDLDGFKRINDSYGHAVGDACLRAVAEVISDELRQGDLLGRDGGEEFIVVLPGAGRAHALAVAERIRDHVQARCHEVDGHPVRLTISIGLADAAGSDISAEALIATADRAMYAAKQQGRNRVISYAAPG